MQIFYLILEVLGIGMMLAAAALMVWPWTKLQNKRSREGLTEQEEQKRKKYSRLMLLLMVVGLLCCFPHMASIMMGQATGQ